MAYMWHLKGIFVAVPYTTIAGFVILAFGCRFIDMYSNVRSICRLQ